jgi:hypothetical protein
MFWMKESEVYGFRVKVWESKNGFWSSIFAQDALCLTKAIAQFNNCSLIGLMYQRE